MKKWRSRLWDLKTWKVDHKRLFNENQNLKWVTFSECRQSKLRVDFRGKIANSTSSGNKYPINCIIWWILIVCNAKVNNEFSMRLSWSSFSKSKVLTEFWIAKDLLHVFYFICSWRSVKLHYICNCRIQQKRKLHLSLCCLQSQILFLCWTTFEAVRYMLNWNSHSCTPVCIQPMSYLET